MTGFGIVREAGGNVSIKDEGVTLIDSVKSIDFTGDMVAGSLIGTEVTEFIDSSVSPITGYLLLAGRVGGQTAAGGTVAGDNLTLVGNAVDGGYVHVLSALEIGGGGATDGVAEILSSNIKDMNPPPELLSNPGFENWTALELADNWFLFEPGDDSGHAPTKSTDSHAGTYAIKFEGGGTLDNVSLYVQSFTGLTPSDSYTTDFYAKGDSVILGYMEGFDSNTWWNFTLGQWDELSPELATDGGMEIWDAGYDFPEYWETINDEAAYLPTKSTDSDVGTYAVQLNSDGGDISVVATFVEELTTGDEYISTFRAKGTGDIILMYLSEDDLDGEYFWNFTTGAWTEVNPDQLTDGDLEVWSDSSTLTNWSTFTTGGGSPSISQESSFVEHGTYACKMLPDAGTAIGISQTATALGTAGDDIELRAYTAADSDTTITLLVANAAGDEIFNWDTESWDAWAGGAPGANQSQDLYAGTGSYNEQSYDLNLPTDVGLTVMFLGDSTVNCYVDAISLRFEAGGPPGADYMQSQTVTASYATYTSTAEHVTVPDSEELVIILAAMSEIKIDEVTLKKDGTGENILTNSGFEDWYTQSDEDDPELTNWGIKEYGDGTAHIEQYTDAEDPDDVYEGYSSVKMWIEDATDASAYLYQTVDTSSIDAGEEVAIGFRFKNRSGSYSAYCYVTNGAGNEIWNWDTENWDAYAGAEPTSDYIDESTGTDSWGESNLYIDNPTSQSIVVYIGIEYPTDSMYFDDISVWIDDDQPTDDYLHEFTLTANYAAYQSPATQVTVPTGGEFAMLLASTTDTEYLDDVSLKKDGSGTDIILNGGFEDWSPAGEDLDDWTLEEFNGDGGETEKDSSIKHSGSYSLKMTNNGWSKVYATQEVTDLSSGSDYVFSAWGITGAADSSDLTVVLLDGSEDEDTEEVVGVSELNVDAASIDLTITDAPDVEDLEGTYSVNGTYNGETAYTYTSAAETYHMFWDGDEWDIALSQGGDEIIFLRDESTPIGTSWIYEPGAADNVWNFTTESWDAYTSLDALSSDQQSVESLTTSWAEIDLNVEAPSSETIYPLMWATDNDGIINIDDASLSLDASGGIPTEIWKFTNENDYNDLTSDDTIFLFETDDGVNQKTFLELYGDGHLGNDADELTFDGDLLADNLSGTNTGDQNDHNAMTNLLTGDAHTQYVMINGRSLGQSIYGGVTNGENIYLYGNPMNDGTIHLGNNIFSVSESTGAAYLTGPFLFPDTDGQVSSFINSPGSGTDMSISAADGVAASTEPQEGGDMLISAGDGQNGGADGDVKITNLSDNGLVTANNSDGTLETTTQISELWIVEAHALATFTNDSGSHEQGETVTAVNLAWTYNRNTDDPFSQTINNGVGAITTSLRTTALSGLTLTTSTTYQIDAVGDDTNPTSKTTTIPFYWKRYWAYSTSDLFTGAEVMANFNGSEYATSIADSESFTSGATPTYYYYMYPASFGAVSGWTFNGFTQDVANLEYSDGTSSFGASPTSVSLTNASGGTTDYYIVRSVYQYTSTTDIMAIS